MSAQLKPSGEVTFIPQEYTLCGLCGVTFIMCECMGVPRGCNYILAGLPAPEPTSTPPQLIRRWCSLISMSTSMGLFNASQWYKEQGPALLKSFQSPKLQMLEGLVDDYIATFPTDPNLPLLAGAVGGLPLSKKSKTEQVQAVAAEARAARKIFRAGDWACLTYIGSMLLQNAFQASDPQKYRLDDPDLITIFQNGIGLISSVMGKGFTEHGWQLAMEYDRRPCVGTTSSLASAKERLSFQ